MKPPPDGIVVSLEIPQDDLSCSICIARILTCPCSGSRARAFAYYLIASPAGAYFTCGVKPLSIWLSEHWTRAGKGGTGAAKTGGNYAAGLLPQTEAYDNGCAQVPFLDSVEGKYVEELGGMNVVLVRKDGTLITPESHTILKGITLCSLLQLARDRTQRGAASRHH